MLKIKFRKGSLSEAGKKPSDAWALAYNRLSDVELMDKNIKILLRAGYVPIMRFKQTDYDEASGYVTSMLGQGAYGAVYECVDKKGHRLAVKVSNKYEYDDESGRWEFIDDNENEFQIRKKLKSLTDELPKSVSKHIVKLKDAIEVPTGGRQKGAYVMALELMVPMNETQRKILYSGMNSISPERDPTVMLNKMLQYPNQIYVLVKQYLLEDEAKLENLTDGYTLPKFAEGWDSSKIKKIILGHLNDLKDDVASTANKTADYKSIVDDISDTFADTIVDNIWHDSKLTKDEIPVFFDPRAVELKRISTKAIKQEFFVWLKYAIINAFLTKLEYTNETPEGEYTFGSWFSDSRGTISKEDEKTMTKEVRSFVKALLYLVENYGIKWGDLHAKNVMIHPRTGDYVAVDIGLFKMSNKKK
jgi:hypothetical protein